MIKLIFNLQVLKPKITIFLTYNFKINKHITSSKLSQNLKTLKTFTRFLLPKIVYSYKNSI